MEARKCTEGSCPSLSHPKRFKPTLRCKSSARSPLPKPANCLLTLHSFLRELFPGLPPLEPHTPSSTISEEIKAVVLTITKGRYEAQTTYKLALQQDMATLESIKAELGREEADIEEKGKRVERRMQEVEGLHMAVKQGEAELREKEKEVNREKVRLVKIAKSLSHKEGVLEAFEKSLEEEQRRLEAEQAAFVASKEEWLSVHPSSRSPLAYRTPLDSTPASCDSPVFPV